MTTKILQNKIVVLAFIIGINALTIKPIYGSIQTDSIQKISIVYSDSTVDILVNDSLAIDAETIRRVLVDSNALKNEVDTNNLERLIMSILTSIFLLLSYLKFKQDKTKKDG
jgi:hypothetical protein